MKQLRFDQVSVADTLEALEFVVTTSDVIAGAMATRDYSPLHHDRVYATEQAGHRDIFLNTQQQAAFVERYLSDWSGPDGRPGRMRLRMKSSVYAGDRFRLSGQVRGKTVDEYGCGWLEIDLQLAVAGRVCTECEVRYALPRNEQDRPWMRGAGEWLP